MNMKRTVNQLLFVCEKFPRGSRKVRHRKYFSPRTSLCSRCRIVVITTRFWIRLNREHNSSQTGLLELNCEIQSSVANKSYFSVCRKERFKNACYISDDLDLGWTWSIGININIRSCRSYRWKICIIKFEKSLHNWFQFGNKPVH